MQRRPLGRLPWHPTRVQRLALLLIVLAVVASGIIIVITAGNSTAEAIAVGVMSSFVASLVLLACSTLVEPDSAREAVASLDRTVTLLAGGAPLLEHAREHGIRAVKPKGAYRREEWIGLLEGAQEELFIVGHALDKWCVPGVRDAFTENIIRLLDAGKTVQLVALPLKGEVTKQLAAQRSKDYTNRIELTLETLCAIREKISERERANLAVRCLAPNVTMPYMVAGNERTLITAPYPAADQDSGRILAVTIDKDTPIGNALRQDVTWLISKYSTEHDWNVATTC